MDTYIKSNSVRKEEGKKDAEYTAEVLWYNEKYIFDIHLRFLEQDF